jgi:hypothetical protein
MLTVMQLRVFVIKAAILNAKIKIYKTIILPFLFECENWSLTLREEHGLRVFGNRVLRRIFEPKSNEITEGQKNCKKRGLIICTLHQMLIRITNQ